MNSADEGVDAPMNDIISLLAAPGASVAVVGATDNPGKYGAVIYRDLKRKGFPVFAVNRHRRTVDGDPAYATLADLPEAPTVVNFVVPPDQTLEVLREAEDLGYLAVWVQPGAESSRVLEYLDDGGFSYLVNACIMVSAPAPVPAA
jgi:predicted CoA-binding protein